MEQYPSMRQEKNSKNNYGVQWRVGTKFAKEVDDIKAARLEKDPREERASSEKISNLIVKHKFWNVVKRDIIEATKQEVEAHGSE